MKVHASLWSSGVAISYKELMAMPEEYFHKLYVEYAKLMKKISDGVSR